MTTRMSDEELAEMIKAMTGDVPQDTELGHIVRNLHAPISDDFAEARYVALVAGGAVLESLRYAIARELKCSPNDVRFDAHPYRAFEDRIKQARKLGLVNDEEVRELRRIKVIRDAFAHNLTRIGFDHPLLTEMTRRIYRHPVSDYDAYFAPAFPPRQHYAIACAEFVAKLTGISRFSLRAEDPS